MDRDVCDRILSAAIAAPSGHNAQPWKFKLLDEASILVVPDKSRSLSAIDPIDRELFISLGCVVENMCVAAAAFGMKATVECKGESGVLVSFVRAESVGVSPLFEAIYRRHTNRNMFDGTGLSAAEIKELSAYGGSMFARGSAQFDAVIDGINRANCDIYGNRMKKNELGKWIRYNRREADNERGGIGYDVLGVPNMPAWISRAATSVALNASMQSRADIKKLQTSPYVVAFAANNDIEGWIGCGRKLQGFLLTATLLDVACAFIGAPCEVEQVASELTSRLQSQSRLQVLLRIGHSAPPLAYSRRRPLAEFKKFKSVT